MLRYSIYRNRQLFTIVFSCNDKGDKMDNREAYEQKAQAKYNQLNAEIEKINAKLSESDADMKIKYNEKINELNQLREDVQNKLHDIKNSSEEAWEDLKNGFENSSKAMKEAVESAISKFK